MKIYTRTGDDGTTGLFGGGRVLKDHPRVRAYGTVDETNAVLGAALAMLPGDGSTELRSLILSIQNDLFDLGSDLATPFESRATVPRIRPEQVGRLEAAIDAHELSLRPLKNFILPGGAPAAAMLHLARTVCRRAERHVVAAMAAEVKLNAHALKYLNRLSDLLFVLARHVSQEAGLADIAWQPNLRPQAASAAK